ncbi:hypothetical protein E4U16_007491 [Claviceps sp. LM84 group G4]|nr:hypothetical protein E4U16_007491 [Claviceps sp. LM84 group G4]
MLLPRRRWKSLFRRWCKSLFRRWWKSHFSRSWKQLFSRWWKTLFSCWRKTLFSCARNPSGTRNSSRERKRFSGRAWKPLSFPNEGFTLIPADHKIDEETLPDYDASHFYPVKIGEIFRDRYQVVGKLGYGITSTVWLARDLVECRHVTVKLFGESKAIPIQDIELNAYKRIENTSIDHPGRHAVRSLLDSFDIDGPNGRHRCLVHPPLWESIFDLRHRNPVEKLPEPVIAHVLKRLFLALDLLHQECNIAHTDIKENNILLEADEAVFRAFEQAELDEPCPRKELDGRTIYESRELNIPRVIGAPVLCDFGSAIPLDDGTDRWKKIQPDVYRAPEVILDIPWTSSVDIWNVGCMIWDAFEGEHLFTGHDSEFKTYQSRAHLAEMIALLGPPPPTLLARASLKTEFFSDANEFCAGISIPESRPLEQRLTLLEGEERESFLRFMSKMLQWEPEKRSSAKDLAEDEWILRYSE